MHDKINKNTLRAASFGQGQRRFHYTSHTQNTTKTNTERKIITTMTKTVVCGARSLLTTKFKNSIHSIQLNKNAVYHIHCQFVQISWSLSYSFRKGKWFFICACDPRQFHRKKTSIGVRCKLKTTTANAY